MSFKPTEIICKKNEYSIHVAPATVLHFKAADCWVAVFQKGVHRSTATAWLSYNLQLLLILILSPCSSVFYFLGKTWRVWYVRSLQPENWLHIFVEIAQLPGADVFGESQWQIIKT